MRVARTLVSMTLLAAAGSARADDQLQGLVSTSAGATDNVLSAPEDPIDPMDLPPQNDVFVSISPGLLYSVSRPRQVHRILYVFDFTAYANHSEANSYSNRLTWSGAFTTSPRSEIQTTAGVTQGRISTFETRLPTGDDLNTGSGEPTTFISVGGSEDYNYQLSPNWLLKQSAGLTTLRSFEELGPSTLEGALGGGLERAWRFDAMSLGLRFNYTGSFVALPAEDEHQLVSGLEGRWRHDIGNYWTTELRLNTVVLANLRDLSQYSGPRLGGGGTVSHVTPDRTLGASYNRDVRANLFTSDTVGVDEVALFGIVPIRWLRDTVLLNATAAYQRSQEVSFAGESDSTTHLFRGEAVLAWSISEPSALMLRYDYTNQRAGGDNPALLDFSRHAVMLSFGAVYPSRAAAELPYRQALRVNRADQVPKWDDEEEDRRDDEERGGEPREGVGN